jgi:dipeptidyl aminopeptidase/acylaminoacyl peptidase
MHVNVAEGGEAAQLTTEENGVGQFDWSPDGSSIVFVSSGPETKARKDRKEKYGDFAIIGGDYTLNHLWSMKVPAEIPSNVKQLPKPEALTKGEEFAVTGFSWSPDGARIAFSAARDPDPESIATEQVYVLDLSDLHVRKLDTYAGPNRNPQWSPDGKQIAFQTSGGQTYFFFMNARIAVVGADGGKPQIVTSSFDEDANLLAWGGDGIYFSAWQKTSRHLFSLNPNSGAIRRITLPDAFLTGAVSFTKDYRTVVLAASSPNHFPEVFTSPTTDFAPKKLTDMAAQWDGFRLGTREVVTWNSADGTPIEGILIKPADYDASRKYPLLVMIHGGPTGVDTPGWARTVIIRPSASRPRARSFCGPITAVRLAMERHSVL